MTPRRAIATLLLASLYAASASAEDEHPEAPRRPLVFHARAEVGPDEPVVAPETARAHAEQRPFVYALDPTTPSRGDASVEYAVGLASGVRAERPLPAGLGYDGAAHGVTVAYGVTARFAPFVTARVLQPSGEGRSSEGGGAAGFRYQLTEPASAFRLTVAAAGARELGGAFAAWGRVAASYDVARVRFVGNVHAERAFASRRDTVDVMLIAGASYRALDFLRVGGEYVGQDVEEPASSGAEGGARHYGVPPRARRWRQRPRTRRAAGSVLAALAPPRGRARHATSAMGSGAPCTGGTIRGHPSVHSIRPTRGKRGWSPWIRSPSQAW